MQICPAATTASWALQDKETHLSNNRSRCRQIRVTIQKHNHKYERRAAVVSPPEAAPLTFDPSGLCQHCRRHTRKRREAGGGKREKDKARISVRDTGRQGPGGGQAQSAPRGAAPPTESLDAAFEDLHSGSPLERVEHSDNLFKEKQMTPQAKGHGGTLVKTFCVSLHCSLSMPFEDRFHYNNIPNQSLNSPSTTDPPHRRLSGDDIISWNPSLCSSWQGTGQSHVRTQVLKVKAGL